MTSRRARAVTLSLAALGVCVVVAFGVAFKDEVVEWWWLQRAENDDPALRAEAADKLGKLGSARTLARLVRIATSDRDGSVREAAMESFWRHPSRASSEAALEALETGEISKEDFMKFVIRKRPAHEGPSR